MDKKRGNPPPVWNKFCSFWGLMLFFTFIITVWTRKIPKNHKEVDINFGAFLKVSFVPLPLPKKTLLETLFLFFLLEIFSREDYRHDLKNNHKLKSFSKESAQEKFFT